MDYSVLPANSTHSTILGSITSRSLGVIIICQNIVEQKYPTVPEYTFINVRQLTVKDELLNWFATSHMKESFSLLKEI